MNAIVWLKEVSVSLSGFEILSDLSVAFPEKQATFIVGKAGSGKSTLLKTAAGLIQPDSGHVFYWNRTIAHMNRAEELKFRRYSSFVFQDAALWANQNIFNNLAWPLAVHEPKLSKNEVEKRVNDIARRVGYDESLTIRPADCSAGEQKLISIARALILDPDLLFMDEPTASMDEQAVERLLVILMELKAALKTILIVSHDPRLIAEIADQLCVLAAGKILGFGPAEEVAPLISDDLLNRIKLVQVKKNAIDGSDGGI